MTRIAVLPGDGIGPEVVQGPVAVLEEIAARGVVELTGPWPVGASAFASHGDGLPAKTLEACEEADAILFGAAGEHPGVPLAAYRPEESLLRLREHFDLRVSVRQVVVPGRRPLTIVRNLLGGAYGTAATRRESDGSEPAGDELRLTPPQIEELAEIACDLVEQDPGSTLLSVDKANLFATSRLWRGVVAAVAARRRIPIRHVYVDRCAFEIAHDDVEGAVILTEGIFGDILSDLAAGRAGSIALCGSASVNPGPPARGRCVGLFEPVHGSAPRHAGARRANPTGAFLATASLLKWFDDTAAYGATVRAALDDVLRAGPLTYDLAGKGESVASTDDFSAAVVAGFSERAAGTHE
jgi:isocitrate/isopropylmalate dehydrogenase